MANLNSAKFNLSGYNKALTKVVTGYFCLACHDYFDKKKVEEERGKERKREKSEKIYIYSSPQDPMWSQLLLNPGWSILTHVSLPFICSGLLGLPQAGMRFNVDSGALTVSHRHFVALDRPWVSRCHFGAGHK